MWISPGINQFTLQNALFQANSGHQKCSKVDITNKPIFFTIINTNVAVNVGILCGTSSIHNKI